MCVRCTLSVFLLSLSVISSGQGLNVRSLQELCGSEIFYTSNLTSRIWRLNMPEARCLHPKANATEVTGCEITMAFCQPVRMKDTCSSSSVCESYATVNDTYSLAAYDSNQNPFNTRGLPFNEKGFSTNFKPGEKYVTPNKTTCQLQTTMIFICNVSAVWNVDGTEDILTVPVIPSVQFTAGADICTYNLTFDFAGACPRTISQNLLSAGSVMLMIFVVFSILYFVMGYLINVTRGKTGDELIPHHRFWAALPVYIAAGCEFTFTCGGRRFQRTYEAI